MDTPERKQITTPISKFEDSPVFNYINSLSPIKPVKSVHITQTFNALSFASLPSIFTSPHVSSLKESRFSQRHLNSDPSGTQKSSESGGNTSAHEEVVDVARNSVENQQKLDESSAGKAPLELSRALSYDCGSSPTTRCGTATKCVPESAGTSTSIVPFGQGFSNKGLFGSKPPLEGIAPSDKNKESEVCDWETLVCETAGLFVFDSPDVTAARNSPLQKLTDSETRFCTALLSQFPHDDPNDIQETKAVGRVGSCEPFETEKAIIEHDDGCDPKEDDTHDVPADALLNTSTAGEPSGKIDDEPDPQLQRGMRRRCLVFEAGGARRKHLIDSTSGGIPSSSLSGENNFGDRQLVLKRHSSDSRSCVVPGIGLHLNAIASTSKDYSIVKHEKLVSRDQLISAPGSSVVIHSLSAGQEPLNKSLAAPLVGNGMVSSENGVQAIEDPSQAGHVVGEDSNQSSPRKKRRRLENAGDAEGCKRCNCKKSKCLKLYCECFAAGVYCVEPCSCQDCFNKPIHEDTVLATRKQIESRNPLAFAPKVIRSSDSAVEIGDDSSKTPSSARHKRGCNCKKSGCLKKYCECYQSGVGCSINCRCEGCKNAFGRKYGSAIIIGTESEQDEEETETCENSEADRSSHRTGIESDVERNPDSGIPATPLLFGRTTVHLPFSKGKPPRSSFHSTGSSSSSFHVSQRLGKPNQPSRVEPKPEKRVEAIVGDGEVPEILQEERIKNHHSPNSKRVSPPHSSSEFGGGLRSSRKLILQSIPSFPSLNPKD